MYFDAPGKENTIKTLELARDRAAELDISEIVVATTTGETAYRAKEICTGRKVIAVTYHCGWREPFTPVMPDDTRRDLVSHGIPVVSATHALSGIERAIDAKFGGVSPVLLVATTLKLMGQGPKVAVEVSVMAADAGVLSGEDIIAVGGSSKGADAALVIKPAHQNNFFDLRIREIVCKPRNF